MALLLLPLIAYFLGVRQPLLENRGKTAFPALTSATVRHDSTFRQMDAAIRERLPLRGKAIMIRGRAMMKVFGESSNAAVILGKENWLYYRPELLICEPNGRPDVPPEDVIEVLTRTIHASGRRPVVIVAGSKIVTHQAHLNGVTDSELDCLERVESRVQKRLQDIPGGYSIQAELNELEAAGSATFLRSDTHWNARGRKIFLRTVLDGVRPGLAAQARLRADEAMDRPGDLGPMLGQDRVDRDRRLTVTGRPTMRFAHGELLIVGDSQLWNSIRTPGSDGKTVLEHVFPGQAVCDQYQMQKDGCAKPMLGVDTVVLESVARNYQLLSSTCWRPVAALAASMNGYPAFWAGGARTLRLSTEPAPARIVASSDRSEAMRLLRIPVLGLSADQVADPATTASVSVVPGGRPRPCSLNAVPDDGFGEIVIPLAAGESVDDVELTVSGPSGVRLGRPELLDLAVDSTGHYPRRRSTASASASR